MGLYAEALMCRVRWIWVLVLLGLVAPAPAGADPVSSTPSEFSWQTWSENQHRYGIILAPQITWDAASAAAAELAGGTWHLATITSAAEQDFVAGLSLSGRALWLGGSQAAGSSSAGSGWSWTTGESFGYQNWAAGEANDYYGAGSEQHLAMWVTSRAWNDEGNLRNISGFLVESPAPVPEPGTMMLVGLAGGALVAARRRKRQTL